MTPVYARIGRTLVKSIQNPTIVQDKSAERDFGIPTGGLTDSIARALANEDDEFAQTRWSDAIASRGYLKEGKSFVLGMSFCPIL